MPQKLVYIKTTKCIYFKYVHKILNGLYLYITLVLRSPKHIDLHIYVHPHMLMVFSDYIVA